MNFEVNTVIVKLFATAAIPPFAAAVTELVQRV